MKKVQKPKVLIGIPTYKNVSSLSYMAGISTIVNAGSEGILATVSGKVDMYITTARNELCEYAIDLYQRKLATHLFQMDDDMVVPSGAITKLLSHNVEVVSGAYWGKDLHPIVYDFLPKDDTFGAIRSWSAIPLHGLRKADGLGGGCLLTDIRVLKKMQDHYSDKRWFQNYDGDRYLGEDVFFFQRLKDMGIPAYIDCDTVCGHVGPIVIDRGVIEASLRNNIENVVLVRRRLFSNLTSETQKKQVRCHQGCSYCCKNNSFLVDIVDGIVALHHLKSQGYWCEALQKKLLLVDQASQDICPFLQYNSCLLYPDHPMCCMTHFGFDPPQCGNEGIRMSLEDPEHAKVAKMLLDQLNPQKYLYRLSGAILAANALLEGESCPNIWLSEIK
jgi:Fe-S-cluster containining protein